jgi:hypothetical protein
MKKTEFLNGNLERSRNRKGRIEAVSVKQIKLTQRNNYKKSTRRKNLINIEKLFMLLSLIFLILLRH